MAAGHGLPRRPVLLPTRRWRMGAPPHPHPLSTSFCCWLTHWPPRFSHHVTPLAACALPRYAQTKRSSGTGYGNVLVHLVFRQELGGCSGQNAHSSALHASARDLRSCFWGLCGGGDPYTCVGLLVSWSFNCSFPHPASLLLEDILCAPNAGLRRWRHCAGAQNSCPWRWNAVCRSCGCGGCPASV